MSGAPLTQVVRFVHSGLKELNAGVKSLDSNLAHVSATSAASGAALDRMAQSTDRSLGRMNQTLSRTLSETRNQTRSLENSLSSLGSGLTRSMNRMSADVRAMTRELRQLTSAAAATRAETDRVRQSATAAGSGLGNIEKNLKFAQYQRDMKLFADGVQLSASRMKELVRMTELFGRVHNAFRRNDGLGTAISNRYGSHAADFITAGGKPLENFQRQAQVMSQSLVGVTDSLKNVERNMQFQRYAADMKRFADGIPLSTSRMRELVRQTELLNRLSSLAQRDPVAHRGLASRYGTDAAALVTRQGRNLEAYTRYAADMRQRLAEAATTTSTLRTHTQELGHALGSAHSWSSRIHGVWRGMAAAAGQIWLSWGAIGPLMAGLAPTLAAFKSVNAERSFGWEMAQVGAAAEISDAAVAKLSQTILNMGSGAYTQSPLQMATALRVLAQAGLDTQEALAVLPTVLNIAMVAGTSDQDAALFASGMIAPFRLRNEDGSLNMAKMNEAINQTAIAAQVSQTSIEQMMQSMKQAAPAADKFGLSVSDVSTVLAALARVNITGSSAGTAFRNLLTDLGGRTEKSRKALEALGLSAYNSAGMVKPFMQIVEELRDKLSGMTDQSKQQWMRSFLDERGMRAADVLLNMTSEQLRLLNAQISRGAENMGYVSREAEKMGQSSEGAFRKMGAAWNTMFVRVGEDSRESFKGLMSELTAFANRSEVSNMLTLSTKALLGFASGAVSLVSALSPLAPLFNGAAASGIVFMAAMGAGKVMASAKALVMLVASTRAVAGAVGAWNVAAAMNVGVMGRATAAAQHFGNSLLALVAANPWLAIATAAAVGIGAYVAYLSVAEKKVETFQERLAKLPQDLGAVNREIYEAFNNKGTGLDMDKMFGLRGDRAYDMKRGVAGATDAYVLDMSRTYEAFAGNLQKINEVAAIKTAEAMGVQRSAVENNNSLTAKSVSELSEHQIQQALLVTERKQTFLKQQLEELDKALIEQGGLSERDRNLRMQYEQAVFDNFQRLSTLRTQMAIRQLQEIRVKAAEEMGFLEKSWNATKDELFNTAQGIDGSRYYVTENARLRAVAEGKEAPRNKTEHLVAREGARGVPVNEVLARYGSGLSNETVTRRANATRQKGSWEAVVDNIKANPTAAKAQATLELQNLQKFVQFGVDSKFKESTQQWKDRAAYQAELLKIIALAGKEEETQLKKSVQETSYDTGRAGPSPEFPGKKSKSDTSGNPTSSTTTKTYSPYAPLEHTWEAETAKAEREARKKDYEREKRIFGYGLKPSVEAYSVAEMESERAEFDKKTDSYRKQLNDLRRKQADGNVSPSDAPKLAKDISILEGLIKDRSAAGAVDLGMSVQKITTKTKVLAGGSAAGAIATSGPLGEGRLVSVPTTNRGLRIKPGAEYAGPAHAGTYALAHFFNDHLGQYYTRHGAFRDKSHIGYTSAHNAGRAFDSTIKVDKVSPQTADVLAARFTQVMQANGFTAKDFYVKAERQGQKNKNGTTSSALHWHAQFNNDAAAQRFAQMAQAGQLKSFGALSANYKPGSVTATSTDKKGHEWETVEATEYRENKVTGHNETAGKDYQKLMEKQATGKSEAETMNEYATQLKTVLVDEQFRLELRKSEVEHQRATGEISRTQYLDEQQTLEIEKLRLEQRKELAKILSEGSLTSEQRLELEKLQTAELERQLELARQKREQEEEKRGWKAGVDSSIQDIHDEATNYAQFAKKQIDVLTGGMTKAFETLATTGKLNFRELTTSILTDLAKIYAKMAAMQFMSMMLGGTSGANSGGGSWIGSLLSGLSGSMRASAKGNVFSSSGLVAFAHGGVVNSPTYFGFGNGGRGLMGEQGPEAVVPLSRMPNGDLGISMTGMGGGGSVINAPVTVSVVVNSDGSTDSSSEGEYRQLGEAVRATVVEEIGKSLRPGGQINSAIQSGGRA